MFPQIGDKLDIICPKVDSRITGQYEYFKLYMVSKDQADNCNAVLSPTPLLNCNKPDQDVKFTIKFQEFSPNLWGLEFRKHENYYIICKYCNLQYFSRNKENGMNHEHKETLEKTFQTFHDTGQRDWKWLQTVNFNWNVVMFILQKIYQLIYMQHQIAEIMAQ